MYGWYGFAWSGYNVVHLYPFCVHVNLYSMSEFGIYESTNSTDDVLSYYEVMRCHDAMMS